MKTLILVASLFAHDGDTFINGDQRIRLQGIDAPELSQTCDNGKTLCGKVSRDALQAMIEKGPVECIQYDMDHYKRPVAKCYVNGIDLNQKMVELGQAIAYRKYSMDYVSNEDTAKRNHAGMWNGTFINPWEWRKGKRW